MKTGAVATPTGCRGTNPKNSTSLLKIDNVTASRNDIVVTFTTVAGKTYRLQRCDNLESGSWMIVEDNILGTGSAVQITDASGL